MLVFVRFSDYIILLRFDIRKNGASPMSQRSRFLLFYVLISSFPYFSRNFFVSSSGSDRPYDRPDGFGIEPSDGPVEIVRTVAEHNYGDGLDSKAANTSIRQCTVSNNSCDGIKLWGGGSVVENTLIYGREVRLWIQNVRLMHPHSSVFESENHAVPF